MNRILIALDDGNTYPCEIEKLITDRQSCLEPYLSNQIIRFDLDVRCALESTFVYTNSDLMELREEVLRILEPTFFEGFHNTRVLHKKEIIEGGLQILNEQDYFNRLHSILNELGVSAIMRDAVCKHLAEYLNNKHGNRTGMLSFFTPLSICQDYWKFTQNIGGEVCEFGLSQNFPAVYNSLTTNGYPITVKFVLPFRNIGTYRKDVVAFEFIRFYAAKQLLNYNYKLAFDAYITQPIMPSDIVEIIDFIDNYEPEYV